MGKETEEHDDRDQDVCVQELPDRQLQLQGRRAGEGGRVLLWSDLYLRTDVRVPERVRLYRDQEQMRTTCSRPLRLLGCNP
jgi:hypothetical protein